MVLLLSAYTVVSPTILLHSLSSNPHKNAKDYCLDRDSHKFRECRSTKTCRHWNSKHHQYICKWVISLGFSSASSNESADRGFNSDTISSTNTCSVTKNQQVILLQTIHALAFADFSSPTIQNADLCSCTIVHTRTKPQKVCGYICPDFPSYLFSSPLCHQSGQLSPPLWSPVS